MAASLLLAFASGCLASFDRYPGAGAPERTAAPERGAVAVVYSWQRIREWSRNPRLDDTDEGEVEAAPEWLASFLREEIGFAEVRPRSEPAPWRARIHIRDYQGPHQGSLLYFASAFLIPSTQEWHFALRVALEGPEGGPARSAVRRHRMTVWRDLLLIPFFFAHSPYHVRTEAFRAMARESFAALLEDAAP